MPETPEKFPDAALQSESPKKAIENFWYHYKWLTVFAVFVVVFLIICISQMTGRSTIDAHLLYTGPKLLDRETCESIVASVMEASEVMGGSGEGGNPADYDGDGSLTVDLGKYVYVPESLAMQYKENDLYFNGVDNLSARGDFSNAVMIGEYVIMFLDRSLYEETVGTGAFLEWKDSLGYTPEYAIDAYGIPLADLAIGNMNGFRELPDDTILCCRGKSYVNRINKRVQNEKMYQAELELFRQLVTYQRPAK